jgi:hypothetical protein
VRTIAVRAGSRRASNTHWACWSVSTTVPAGVT